MIKEKKSDEQQSRFKSINFIYVIKLIRTIKHYIVKLKTRKTIISLYNK